MSNIADIGDHNVLLEDHLRDTINDHLSAIGDPKEDYDVGYRIALQLVLTLLNSPSSFHDLIRGDSRSKFVSAFEDNARLHKEIVELRMELAATYDELIDHNGDDLNDTRQNRARELRKF